MAGSVPSLPAARAAGQASQAFTSSPLLPGLTAHPLKGAEASCESDAGRLMLTLFPFHAKSPARGEPTMQGGRGCAGGTFLWRMFNPGVLQTPPHLSSRCSFPLAVLLTRWIDLSWRHVGS